MTQFLIENPLFVLFLIAAIGYPLGRIKIYGSSLGIAAVLFVGLAIGALDENLKLPEILYQLGLVMFVYTIGLSSGPVFFASLRRKGLRDNVFVALMLVVAAGLTVGITQLLDISPARSAGIFAGSLTNTPALAGVVDYLEHYSAADNLDALLTEPVVGYSLTYPMGVVGMILAIVLMQRFWKVDYSREARSLPESGAAEPLESRTIRVTNPQAVHTAIDTLIHQRRWDVIFGRLRHNGRIALSNGQSQFEEGDLVSVIGSPEELERVTANLGDVSDEQLEFDRSQLDHRRVFVSSPNVIGHRIRDLKLPQRFGALVTRLRRGDVDFLPHEDTVLQPGDRVRVVAPRTHLEAVSTFFGDSYRALSEIDFMTFSLGLALGLLVGLIPIPMPGNVTLRLGTAGGPLLVAMVLGRLGRTGWLVWTLPYSANLTLRQVGLILFLAGVGTRSGYSFVTTLTEGNGLTIFLAGALITTTIAFSFLWIGHRLLKIPMSLLIGMLSGLQTQPAVLGFALEQTDNELPNIGYAAVYPTAIIAKILLAQLLVAVLR